MVKVGEIGQCVIDLLQLKIESGTAIFRWYEYSLHEESHPEDYQMYKDHNRI